MPCRPWRPDPPPPSPPPPTLGPGAAPLSGRRRQLPAGEEGAAERGRGPHAPPKPRGPLRACGLQETPSRPRPPGRAPREWGGGVSAARGLSAPPAGRRPTSSTTSRSRASPSFLPFLSRSFSALPPAFRHRLGISAGKRHRRGKGREEGCSAAVCLGGETVREGPSSPGFLPLPFSNPFPALLLLSSFHILFSRNLVPTLVSSGASSALWGGIREGHAFLKDIVSPDLPFPS